MEKNVDDEGWVEMKRDLKEVIAELFLIFFVFTPAFASQANLKIVGVSQVDGQYVGITANLTVMVEEGKGHVFVDTLPLTKIDTQASARLAKDVVCNLLSIDCSKYNFYFIIRSNTPIIGGPSAGGAMAVALMSLLTNVSLNPNVIMTGTINPDGSIGPVGGILEKAQAAYESGANLFLIPKGQKIVTVTEQKVSKIGPITQVITETKKVDITQYAITHFPGMEIKEVADVFEAYKYFTGKEIAFQYYERRDIEEEYNKIMKEMSEDLINYTENLYYTAEKLFERKPEYKNQLENEYEKIMEAKELYDKGDYYSSASYCVGAAIQIKYLINKAQIDLDYLKDEIKVTEDEIDNFINNYSNITLDHIWDVESLLIALDRAYQAEDAIDNAYKNYYLENYAASIYNLSYAQVRIKTAKVWTKFIKGFKGNETIIFNEDKLMELATSRLEEAKTLYGYFQAIYGQDFSYIDAKLERASKYCERRKYVYCLFETIRARSEISLLLTNTIDLDLLSKEAENAIGRAENEGLLPVLAISYYNYAKNFENIGEKEQAAVIYSYSREFARISEEIVKAMNQEVKETQKKYIVREAKVQEYNKLYLFIIIAISLFFGYLVGKI